MSDFHVSLNRALDTEMGRTSWDQSCRNLYDPDRCCRRLRDHDGPCASGFGQGRIRWSDPTKEKP